MKNRILLLSLLMVAGSCLGAKLTFATLKNETDQTLRVFPYENSAMADLRGDRIDLKAGDDVELKVKPGEPSVFATISLTKSVKPSGAAKKIVSTNPKYPKTFAVLRNGTDQILSVAQELAGLSHVLVNAGDDFALVGSVDDIKTGGVFATITIATQDQIDAAAKKAAAATKLAKAKKAKEDAAAAKLAEAKIAEENAAKLAAAKKAEEEVVAAKAAKEEVAPATGKKGAAAEGKKPAKKKKAKKAKGAQIAAKGDEAAAPDAAAKRKARKHKKAKTVDPEIGALFEETAPKKEAAPSVAPAEEKPAVVAPAEAAKVVPAEEPKKEAVAAKEAEPAVASVAEAKKEEAPAEDDDKTPDVGDDE